MSRRAQFAVGYVYVQCGGLVRRRPSAQGQTQRSAMTRFGPR